MIRFLWVVRLLSLYTSQHDSGSSAWSFDGHGLSHCSLAIHVEEPKMVYFLRGASFSCNRRSKLRKTFKKLAYVQRRQCVALPGAKEKHSWVCPDLGKIEGRRGLEVAPPKRCEKADTSLQHGFLGEWQRDLALPGFATDNPRRCVSQWVPLSLIGW